MDQKISLQLNPKIEVRNSPIEGKGLFAKEPFKKGEKFKVAYGEHPWVIMTDKEFQAYVGTVSSYDAVYLGGGKHRVSTLSREEDPTNYGNHCCDPNIAPDGDDLIALRDIDSGEEITTDYAQLSPRSWSMKCNCGAKKCKRVVPGLLS
ncbi:MAG: SET domain-containing protein [Candidatus Binatus sp.]